MYRPGRNKWEAECTVCKAKLAHTCVCPIKVQAILKRKWTQTNIGKLCKYFHIYTVRTESLKEYCDFVDIEYRRMLSHSKTRWLSLFPGIERMIQMFPALKAFFLSQQKPPIVIKKFFENEFSEIYLWHMHSLMSAFHTHIQDLEKEKNSIMEVKKIMNSIHTILLERKSNNFMSLKVKGLLAQKRSDGLGKEYDQFCADVQGLYSTCLEYLEKWMTPMEEFSTFTWMDLSEPPEWNDVEACIKFLGEKGVVIDDVKCFDQVTNLKRFTERASGPRRGTSCLFESLKGILFVQYNLKDMSCKDFHAYLLSNRKLLGKISSTAKYRWADKEDEEEKQDEED
ncbi:Catalase isozyme 1 [Dissostichus eleginoides]|uniref:Catalase isozyme 1 n=1 Tax=Dissostichus eleginoides TaxID=100907 RepID=A0AAD9EV42_DISEL|nr:Catalase isozyme 1 [Dissostichus eleginoides]